jgi:hypothetical protein
MNNINTYKQKYIHNTYIYTYTNTSINIHAHRHTYTYIDIYIYMFILCTHELLKKRKNTHTYTKKTHIYTHTKLYTFVQITKQYMDKTCA